MSSDLDQAFAGTPAACQKGPHPLDPAQSLVQAQWVADDLVVRPLPDREAGQKLHLVLGSPWRAALGAYLSDEGRTEGSFWEPPQAYSKGDLLLTVLDTQPKVYLCLERAARASGRPGQWIWVAEAYPFTPLIPAPVLTDRLGYRLPGAPATLPDEVADEVLTALTAELAAPTAWWDREGGRSRSTSRSRSQGLQAVVLACSGGRCSACERDFVGLLPNGDGMAGMEVHHLDSLGDRKDELVDTTPDRLVALCRRLPQHRPWPFSPDRGAAPVRVEASLPVLRRAARTALRVRADVPAAETARAPHRGRLQPRPRVVVRGLRARVGHAPSRFELTSRTHVGSSLVPSACSAPR